MSFKDDIARGLQDIRNAAGEDVVFDDLVNPSQTLTAVPGQLDVDSFDAVAIRLDNEYHDFMIEKAEFAANGLLEPDAGMTIAWGGDIYTVTNMPGIPPVEWVDRIGRTTYRIHTIMTTDG